MGESISSHRTELKTTIDSATETLRTQLDAFQVENQKRMRDVQADVEGRIKEHKQQLAETREKSEALQEKLFARIDESYRLLSTNITEIDKRVKAFVSQTRLFERADSMKAALEGSIEDMKKEMTKLNADRADITELDAQLVRTKKLAEEVAVKMTRFLAGEEADRRHGRRVQEGHHPVPGRGPEDWTPCRASNDALQQIQAKIRQFEEIGKTVEGGFERLEKKREIISVTSEGVDRNFQRLEGIEKSLPGSRQDRGRACRQVQGLRGEYEVLASNKKDADSVMETVGRLEVGDRRTWRPAGEGAELAGVDGAHGDTLRGDRPPGAGAGAGSWRASSRRRRRRKRASGARRPWTRGRR